MVMFSTSRPFRSVGGARPSLLALATLAFVVCAFGGALVDAIDVCGVSVTAPTPECWLDASVAGPGTGTTVDPYKSVQYAVIAGGCRLLNLRPGTYLETTMIAYTDSNSVLLIRGLGPPDQVVIDMQESDGFFDTMEGGVTLALANITVINGDVVGGAAGGVVWMHPAAAKGAFMSESCHFENNTSIQAGALWFRSTDTYICDSTFTGNTATVGVAGALALVPNYFLNRAATIEIVRSTFSGNSASDEGGAIWHASLAGGLPVSFLLANSTFFSNEAGASVCGGAVYLNTFHHPVTITGNRFIGNKADGRGGAVCIEDATAVTTVSDNEFLQNSNTNGYPGAGLNTNGAINGTGNVFCGNSGAEPRAVNASGGYSGVFEAEYQCQEGGADDFSPACPGCTEIAVDNECSLCAGDESCPLAPIPVEAVCGQAVWPDTDNECWVDAAAPDGATGTIGDPYNSVEEAVITGGCRLLNVHPGTYNETTAIAYTDDTSVLFIRGLGPPDQVVIDMGGSDRFFTTTADGVTLALTNITVTNAMASSGNGGAVYWLAVGSPGTGTLLSENCRYENNTAPGGGAMLLTSVDAYICDSAFASNRDISSSGAGALLILPDNGGARSGTVEVVRSTFSGNIAGGSGGAIRHQLATDDDANRVSLLLADNTFCSNEAGSSGGAAFLVTRGHPVTITGNRFIGNTANGRGGAIRNNLATAVATVSDNEFLGNSANIGAGLYTSGAINGTGNVFCGNRGAEPRAVNASGGYSGVFEAEYQCQKGGDNDFLPTCPGCTRVTNDDECSLCTGDDACPLPLESPSPPPLTFSSAIPVPHPLSLSLAVSLSLFLSLSVPISLPISLSLLVALSLSHSRSVTVTDPHPLSLSLAVSLFLSLSLSLCLAVPISLPISLSLLVALSLSHSRSVSVTDRVLIAVTD